MTDPTPAEPSKSLFEMVPTLDAYLELVGEVATLREHVEELQASIPATDDVDDDTTAGTDDLAQIAAGMDTFSHRIDRHRAEIEQMKRVINQIIKFLGSGSAATIPAATTAADGDTITPTSTGGL